MPNTPLNPDALKWFTYIENAIKDAGYNCNCATTPDNVSIDKDWLDYHLREMKKALLAVAQPEVNSVEELDALPVGSLIMMSGVAAPFLHTDDGWESTRTSGKPVWDYTTNPSYLPARVLYLPKENNE